MRLILTISARTIQAILTLFVLVSAPVAGACAQVPFTAAPQKPVGYFEARRPDRRAIQKFNGVFVQRLARTASTTEARACLRSMGSTSVVVETYDSGSARVASSNVSCAAIRDVSPARGSVTGRVSITASRILAASLALSAFDRDQLFRANDHDLADYDVEMFDKGQAIWVELRPVHPQVMIAGCPSTGATYAGYIVDTATFSVTRVHSAC